MKLSRRLLLAAPSAALAALRAPSAVAEDVVQAWPDPARHRDVPVRLRLPAARGPAPVVVVSHGLGGSRDGLAYLGAALAEAGFIAVHIQHVGSDNRVWQGNADPGLAMAAAVLDVRHAIDRLRDIVFVLDTLPRRPELGERIDPARMAIAGHSFGAWTVTHMLGEALPGGSMLEEALGLSLPDGRLRAGVALSPVPPLGVPAERAYARVQAPILHITGTLDRGVIEAATPEDRSIPYRSIAAPAVLAVLRGAGHAAFAGEAAAGPRWNDPTFHPRIARLATLFLRAVLDGDSAAGALLLHGGGLPSGDRLEHKGEAW